LYDFLLRSYITGKLRTQSINFSSNSSLQLMVYKNTTAVTQATTLRTCCHKTSASSRRRMPHDAEASAQGHGGTLMSATLKNQPPSKPQLWLVRTASRLRKRHCVVVKNQGFIPTSTLHMALQKLMYHDSGQPIPNVFSECIKNLLNIHLMYTNAPNILSDKKIPKQGNQCFVKCWSC
jgi:hypothetical protein